MPARILVIEDDADVRLVLRGHLEPLYDVIEAADGVAGWRRFEEERPDLVLTDLGIPGINGLDLTERIRSHPERGTTPVIILTGATQGEDLPAGFWKMGTGADAFFEKPADGPSLRAEIDRLLKARAGYRELPPGKGYYET
ncbi:MAG: response regulator [Candidatus Sumerlaeia bacterium]|nr:response regulator [Candidatus Sumerlaeia bacterium]